MPPAEPVPRRPPVTGPLVRLAPGVLLAAVVAGIALGVDAGLAGTGVGSPGAPVLALLLGTATSTARAPGALARPGLGWASSRLLQAGIVLLGLTVPLSALTRVGPRALPVVAVAVVTAFATATVLGRALGVGRDLRLLLGAGTGICGASAIAAAAGVLRPRPADVSYALSTVVIMNLLALATLPPLARAVGLPAPGFGAWVGASVNDTSAVVALAGSWSASALTVAVVVKLTRVLALVPVTLVLAWRSRVHDARHPRARADGAGSDADPEAGPVATMGLVPPFLVLFVLAVGLAATGVLPGWATEAAGTAVGGLVACALAGVGLLTRLREVVRAGPAPVLLGSLVWVAVAASTLVTVRLVGLG